MRRLCIALGLAFWGGLVALLASSLLAANGPARGPAARLLEFATTADRTVVADLPGSPELNAGDPVYSEDPERYLVRVGRVAEVFAVEGGRRRVRLSIYPEAGGMLLEGAVARSFSVPDTAGWVLATLLPPERMAEVRQMAATFLDEEGREIRDILWPELETALREILDHMRKELPRAIARNQDGWNELLGRHRDGVIDRALAPAIEEVTIPLARERFEPLLMKVGKKLWKSLPLWSLGWRWVVEQARVAGDELVEERFRKYMEEDAEPILKKHAPEAAEIAAGVIRDSLADPRIQAALSEVFQEVSTDPELSRLLSELADDLVIQNERLHEIVRERWEDGLRDAMVEASRRFDPVIRKTINLIALDEEEHGLNPRLVHVLRTRVFGKDARWVRLDAGTGAPLPDGAEIPGERGDG